MRTGSTASTRTPVISTMCRPSRRAHAHLQMLWDRMRSSAQGGTLLWVTREGAVGMGQAATARGEGRKGRYEGGGAEEKRARLSAFLATVMMAHPVTRSSSCTVWARDAADALFSCEKGRVEDSPSFFALLIPSRGRQIWRLVALPMGFRGDVSGDIQWGRREGRLSP